MCKVLAENEKVSLKACATNEDDPNLGKTLNELEDVRGKVNKLFGMSPNDATIHGDAENSDIKSDIKSGQPSDSCPLTKAENMEVQETVANVKSENQDVEMAESIVKGE